jgi:hypothetical protein
MTDNEVINVYRFGFVFNKVNFVWHKKELYRMPYESNSRCYEKRLLKQQKVGNSIGYWICGTFKSMKNLKEITKEVNIEEIEFVESEIPF